MTKKTNGLTDRQFNALVDEGFKPSTRRVNRGGAKAWVPPAEVIKKLEEEGAAEGLSKSAARFNALCARMLGVKPNTTPEMVAKLTEFDANMRAIAHANGIELRDED